MQGQCRTWAWTIAAMPYQPGYIPSVSVRCIPLFLNPKSDRCDAIGFLDDVVGQSTSLPPARGSIPSIDEIRNKALFLLQKRPCKWQADICQAVLEGNRDIISIAGTGAGKTLTFWLPLLFRPNGVQIVVTPLNILGQQNIDTLAKVGVKGIFISAKTASKQIFSVRI